MEILFILVLTGFGKAPAVKMVMADLVQKISWATFVCVGLAVGSTVSKMRVPAMGLAGIIAAPAAFYVARILHKSAAQALSLAGPAASMPSAGLLALIKALQYAVLGALIARLDRSDKAGFGKYLLTGLVCGLVFGGLIMYLSVSLAPTPAPIASSIARAVNELIFPIGCSLILYSARRLSTQS